MSPPAPAFAATRSAERRARLYDLRFRPHQIAASHANRRGRRLTEAIETAKAIFQAYVDKDRRAAERLIAEDFSFTSPLDNKIDRDAYFEICWPNSEMMTDVDFHHLAVAGDRVFVTYEAGSTSGRRFRNTEILTVRGGRITAVEVYFGWNIPQEVAEGEHRDP